MKHFLLPLLSRMCWSSTAESVKKKDFFLSWETKMTPSQHLLESKDQRKRLTLLSFFSAQQLQKTNEEVKFRFFSFFSPLHEHFWQLLLRFLKIVVFSTKNLSSGSFRFADFKILCHYNKFWGAIPLASRFCKFN